VLLFAENISITELPTDIAEGSEVKVTCSLVYASGNNLMPSVELRNNGHIVELVNISVNAGTVTGTALMTATPPEIGPVQCSIPFSVPDPESVDEHFSKNSVEISASISSVPVLCMFTTCIKN